MHENTPGSPLEASGLSLSYGPLRVVESLDLSVPRGRITALVGANGSGKSTILKALARLMAPAAGQVLLDGRDIHRLPGREVARRLALLPQGPQAPEGLTVEELAGYGRHPHGQGRQMSRHDREAVARALDMTGMADLAQRDVDRLSGGQRQRAWLALALAQDTDLLLLDEPTTYLDMGHQMEIMALLERINREQGKTMVMVVHELNHATRIAHHMVAIRQGRIHRQGPPAALLDEALLKDVFGVHAWITKDPRDGTPVCIPRP